eukprot:TRINITY_DN76_c0_g1_i1.p1 TRINITY_DN76_c0_g1~~TRINITY_DN76_c0_g1_i1.p1  ORF type:complete len:499 (+),score=165.16 TRINITY_DN76_c0_g1_i1:25-1497(+)
MSSHQLAKAGLAAVGVSVAIAVGLAVVGYLWGEDDNQQRARNHGTRATAAAAAKGREGEADDGGGDRATADIEAFIKTADSFVQQARFADAEFQYKKALEKLVEVGGSNTPIAALIFHELGTLYKYLDRPLDAINHFTKAAEIFRAVQQNDEPNVDPLARALCELAEVKSLYTRALREPDVVRTTLTEARAHAEEAITLIERVYTQNPKDAKDRKFLADALKSETQVLMFQKEWPLAETSVRRCLSLLERATFETDSPVVTARMWLSQIQLGEEKYAEACATCKQLADCHAGNEEEAYFLKYYGEVLTDAESYDEADKALTAAMRLYKEAAPNGSDYWSTVNCLACVYAESGRASQAEALHEDMCAHMVAQPETTTKYLRTLSATLKGVGGSSDKPAECTFVLNVLVRDRRSKRVPTGSRLEFVFPQVEETLSKVVEADTKTVLAASPIVSSPALEPNTNYPIKVLVHSPDGQLLATHIQYVRYPAPAAQ